MKIAIMGLTLSLFSASVMASIEEGQFSLSNCKVDGTNNTNASIQLDIGSDSITLKSESNNAKNTIDIKIDENSALKIDSEDCVSEAIPGVEGDKYLSYHLSCGGMLTKPKTIDAILTLDKESKRFVYAKTKVEESKKKFDYGFLKSLGFDALYYKGFGHTEFECKTKDFKAIDAVPVEERVITPIDHSEGDQESLAVNDSGREISKKDGWFIRMFDKIGNFVKGLTRKE